MAQTAPAGRLSIVTPPKMTCIEQQPCTLRLEARAGQPPFRWRVADGKLPKGLDLDVRTGVISGTPQGAQDATVTIEVRDSSSLSLPARRPVTIRIEEILAIDWLTQPRLAQSTFSGSLDVRNQSRDQVVITMIAVAVNQIGKAFTLGYQHFTMAAGTVSPVIPFSMSVPPGRYRLRVDVVGEVLDKNRIYRSAREAGPFNVE